jgi:hypothetical protein
MLKAGCFLFQFVILKIWPVFLKTISKLVEFPKHIDPKVSQSFKRKMKTFLPKRIHRLEGTNREWMGLQTYILDPPSLTTQTLISLKSTASSKF